jgi:hypothetical protein
MDAYEKSIDHKPNHGKRTIADDGGSWSSDSSDSDESMDEIKTKKKNK